MCRSGISATLLRALILGLCLLAPAAAGAGQLGSLVSPGPLAKAHASLEGASNCAQCHETGRRVTAARCLTCHKPVADRIAKRTGVHRSASECVSCHVEHAGVDAELRHLDRRTFNHALETGFPLDGQHAKVAGNCVACHKTRSFLDARPACGSCHADVHKGSLGAACTSCHSTSVAFKQARSQFDHTMTRFPLTGKHGAVDCVKCHKTASAFRGIAFGSCASCHEDPHRKKFGASCSSCHTTTETWDTRSVDHSKTSFPLAGAHAQVACTKCHQSGEMTRPVRFDRCSACHVNVHRDSVKEDCATCHTVATFKGAGPAFDHAKRTAFALDGKHDGLACRACHTQVSAPEVPLAKKAVDFSGAKTECVSCHASKDPHKGAFGQSCEACHRPATFSVKNFTHPRAPDFFGGQHAQVACEKCHVNPAAAPPRLVAAAQVVAKASAPRTLSPSMTCVSCHADVHLGQLGAACDTCHTVEGVKFKAVGFSHERSQFPLTGKHQTAECAKCHTSETRLFPARSGMAVVFKPMDVQCQSCHKDPHLGQVDARCETCHSTSTFALTSFAHRGMDDFFGGLHGKYACIACHKKESGQFPAGRGTAVRFIVGRTCMDCHRGF